MTRAIICGGRNFRDRTKVNRVLDAARDRLGLDCIIQGGADGADFYACEWAFDRDLGVCSYNADWKAHGKKAGPIRNARMLSEGNPDFVIAFPGGAGTEDMCRQAEAAGVTVYRIP